MKLIAFEHQQVRRIGLVENDRIRPLLGVSNLQELILLPERILPDPHSQALTLEQVRLLPIIEPRRNVICVGWNYRKHFDESIGKREGQGPEALPEVPTFFTKATGSVAAANDDLPLHAGLTSKLDWEVELAVVIGLGGRDIDEANALSHVYGYTIANDISARDLQRAHGAQWFKGKSLDGTCPLGPVLVTADDIVDPQALTIECHINGVVMQRDTTANQIFSVARLIADLSRGMTLEPGDVILTGTPDGIGAARVPALFLADGDLIESRIQGIGTLRNLVLGTVSAATPSNRIVSLSCE
ncbi:MULTISPECIES: fumarylacetoacetate hydrolase family protein [unclassified Pseudomonas]|uniref:fumarylacetoacetate hydrolase family protein n=1 Tax=unclassified Pseudomonas TaxID=196821 RepID=UPI0008716AAE|nr:MULTISPECIES: fumarylacetoacetate hydrolase family protein [unclassified Pseudomonas]SCW35722.1 2-keto-4-pentenoate hydratase/2-oxohepta-3-ene-1,7-dioic acid hydratase (catechol pathway) [Pseudomonas sp. NFACC56-3]SFK16426.1 2-keto-4-pentenoate hydratase/2-oxohepta-3-ene-1,7-dioic acid hydratase (catechol pathway) [Pseudomonas sp. NFACC52]